MKNNNSNTAAHTTTAMNPVDDGIGIWGSNGFNALIDVLLEGGTASQKYSPSEQDMLKPVGVLDRDIVEGDNVGDNVGEDRVGGDVDGDGVGGKELKGILRSFPTFSSSGSSK